MVDNVIGSEKAEPLNEKLMVFLSWPDFTNNCLVLWEYIKANTDYETVWIIDNETIRNRMKQEGITCCSFAYDDAIQYLSNAKYVVFERCSPHHFPKPKGQITVHMISPGPMYGELFTHTPMIEHVQEWLKTVIYRSAVTDIFVTSSYFERVNVSAMHFIDARKVFATGLPRLDPIFNMDGKKYLFEAMPSLKKYDKLILYSPSVRMGAGYYLGRGFIDNIFILKDLASQDLERLLEKYNAAIACKIHPSDEQYFSRVGIPELPKHCYMINSNSFWRETIYHLLNAFDIMITDYSQLSYEFLLLDRPILFNNSDYDEVLKTLTPIVEDESLIRPGQKYNNSPEFLSAIETALKNPKSYHEERMKFMPFVHKYIDGNSSKRILELMENYTPFKNPYETVFAAPLKQQLDESNRELALAQEALSNTHNHLENIISSRDYRIFNKCIATFCPPNSIRRKIIHKCFSALNIIRRKVVSK